MRLTPKQSRTKRGKPISMPAMPATCRSFVAAPCSRACGIEGPAIIEEQTSTTVLYPGQRAEVDAYLNIEVALP